MVIDASVAFKWFMIEEGSDAAIALIGEPLIAPSLLVTEVGNAFWRKATEGQFDPSISFANEIARVIDLVQIHANAPLISRALEIARQLRHPIYDCVYLALAEQEADRVVTADQRFAAKAVSAGYATLIEALA